MHNKLLPIELTEMLYFANLDADRITICKCNKRTMSDCVFVNTAEIEIFRHWGHQILL
jgi:hypothetical protein